MELPRKRRGKTSNAQVCPWRQHAWPFGTRRRQALRLLKISFKKISSKNKFLQKKKGKIRPLCWARPTGAERRPQDETRGRGAPGPYPHHPAPFHVPPCRPCHGPPMATTALSCSPSPSSTLLRRTVSGFHRRSDARLRRIRLAPLHVVDDSKEVGTAATGDRADERSETDKLIDGMDFGELCDDFECISSPYVESTARQIARDILEIREGNRALSCYAVTVKYKDPLRTFVGREKYKRPLWITDALENPTVTVQEMSMQSTSTLTIKWTLRGKPKNPFFSAVGGELIIRVDSLFVLNQISGQVLEHVESWDLSASSPPAQAYFWLSRRVYSTVEAGKDIIEAAKGTASRLSEKKDQNLEIYPDPSGDPTKFFTRPDDLNQDVYQIALFLAVLYFIVQFLKTTL